MRRIELINAAERVVSAMEQSALRQAFIAGRGPSPENTARVLVAYHKFGLLAANFGEPEREMLRRMGLEILLDSAKAVSVILSDQPGELRLIIRGILYSTEFLPRFVELVEPDYVRAITQQEVGLPKVLAGKTSLTVIAIEEKQQFSPPTRIIEIMQSVTLMYEAIGMLNGESTDDLILLTCDSGSDKSFDFLGVAKLVEQVKELILSLWDKVVFFREKQVAERIELVAKSLPIIEKVASMRESLGPEKTEIIIRKILDGAEKFLNNGATIPEIMNVSSFNSRALLAPARKLLMEPPSPSAAVVEGPEPVSPTSSEGNLSPDEHTELRRLMKKMMKGDSRGSEVQKPLERDDGDNIE